jgi:hypothetical protein
MNNPDFEIPGHWGWHQVGTPDPGLHRPVATQPFNPPADRLSVLGRERPGWWDSQATGIRMPAGKGCARV